MRPWLVQIGPMFVPADAREELAHTAHNLTPEQYSDVIWAERSLGIQSKRPRSKSWPPSCYSKALKGYVLPSPAPSNITRMPVKGRKS